MEENLRFSAKVTCFIEENLRFSAKVTHVSWRRTLDSL
jgi:hypothetical protein